MRRSILFILILEIAIIHMFYQNNYRVTLEFARVKYANTSILYNFKLKARKPNRTTTGFSNSFCTKMKLDGEEFKGNPKVFKIIDNMAKPTVIDFDFSMCHLVMKNLFGGQILAKNGNFTKCPLEKGCYGVNPFLFDQSRFPPYVPEGPYKVEFRMFIGKSLIALYEIYGSVSYDIA